MSARDHLSADEFADVSDGVDLYHRTNPQAAGDILASGFYEGVGSFDQVYFSDQADPPEDSGGLTREYGDSVVHVRVPRSVTQVVDNFGNEQHLGVPAASLTRENIVRAWTDLNH